MKSREYIIVYIIPMVLALVFLILALRMEHFSSRILPLVMSGFCLVLGGVCYGCQYWPASDGCCGLGRVQGANTGPNGENTCRSRAEIEAVDRRFRTRSDYLKGESLS